MSAIVIRNYTAKERSLSGGLGAIRSEGIIGSDLQSPVDGVNRRRHKKRRLHTSSCASSHQTLFFSSFCVVKQKRN